MPAFKSLNESNPKLFHFLEFVFSNFRSFTSRCRLTSSEQLLGSIPVPNNLKEHGHVYDVLIVGAGWAGIAAASTLKKHGITNVEILEARDSVGGRSRTIYPFAPDLPMELGSAWTYNDTEPHEFLLEQELPYGEVHYADIDRWGLYFAREGQANAKKAKRYDKLWDDYTEFSEAEGTRIEESGHDKPYQAIIDAYTIKKRNELSTKEETFLKTMVQAQIEIEYAAPVQGISGGFAGDAVGECVFCKADYFVPVQGGGFDKILRPLLKSIKDKIKLRRKVTRVEYGDTAQLAKVIYTDDTGRQHAKFAKNLLMTVPLGVLKKQAIDFVPPLPQAKQDAIDVLGFGILNKCIFYWEEDQSSWWPKGKEMLTFVPADQAQVGSFTTFFNDKQLGNGGHFVLSAWTAGESARAIEKLPDSEIVNMVMTNLRSMLGNQVPRPSNHVISRWGQDEFAYGAYSYVSVGRGSLVDSARRELGARTASKLFWAGEATHPVWSGSTVGAYRSGVTAAEDILLTLRHRLHEEGRKPVMKTRRNQRG
ncbi:specific histone demethylase 1 homolog [Seminavis robusta]|uniref:Amine oxidase n=1 Tax=Seminavis robusta TaxID=568900 RepID=A0A9N8E4R8_9STRA|nr:specific histone demethylase 1 homolog [Seminavis robusta]|eukprot:Sro619_g176360.1 specific histone demethylase 1 homolog (536) ;mRNA; f:5783-7390